MTVTALAQARHVFLGGNQLLGTAPRWAGRDDFTLLDTRFGAGHNLLATWDAWRRDPQRSTRLNYLAIATPLLGRAELARQHADSPLPALVHELLAAWPPLTPGLHLIDLEGGRLRLLLATGDASTLLARVDAFYLDAASVGLIERLARLAAPSATLACDSAAPALHDALRRAGFEPEPESALTPASAAAAADDPTSTRARHAPQFRAPAPPGALHTPSHERSALIIGAGLAGCAAAAALARLGWRCNVIDALPAPAGATSGNAVGLMHATLHADDGPHARVLRAGALHMARSMAPLLAAGTVRGRLDGFLRLEDRLDDTQAAALLSRTGMPADFVQWLDRRAARARSGLALASGGWYYPQGGWLAPATVAAAWLAASSASFIGGRAVARLQRQSDAWSALDADGVEIAAAPVLVLANALAARPLLASIDASAAAALGPLSAVRGQLSAWRWHAGLPAPQCAVSGAGYTLPVQDGWLWSGATSQHDDADPTVRGADHAHNRERLTRLLGVDEATLGAPEIGRVGWRAQTPDRLPLIGALPDLHALAAARRADAPRLVPRIRSERSGLYVFTGLGSRGLSHAALGAELLASWISGAPCPVEADLRDALDPARFALRAQRRA